MRKTGLGALVMGAAVAAAIAAPKFAAFAHIVWGD
jgi:hypothetical protein